MRSSLMKEIHADRLQTQKAFPSIMAVKAFLGVIGLVSQASVWSEWSAHESWGNIMLGWFFKVFKVNLMVL